MNDSKPGATTLSKKLSQLRAERGWSLSKLSTQTGIAISSISLYESGQRTPHAEVLVRLASAFRVGLDELMGFDVHALPALEPEPPPQPRGASRPMTQSQFADLRHDFASLQDEVRRLEELLRAHIVTLADEPAAKRARSSRPAKSRHGK